MYTWNMPERKNRRRKSALARLGSRRTDTAERRNMLAVETAALHERIKPTAFYDVSRKIGGPGLLNRPRRRMKASS